ncbi:hypothetical protein FJZ40_01070 [Candidatus Shapirobacteria bacterium]|nr:hypothetical protein [Candidatus Shapirobacteria bacterium]
MNFYQEIITQKSWQVLKNLQGKFAFTLIGGWAVWLYTHALKSKDIDIIVGYEALGELKRIFEVSKNGRLKKYEAKVAEVDLDIYLPFYSNPGLPAELIQKYARKREGFSVPRPEILLILKQKVFEERKASIKGQKDKLDIFSLLTLDLDLPFYQKALKETGQEELIKKLKDLFQATVRLKEISLNDYQMAKLKERVLKGLL